MNQILSTEKLCQPCANGRQRRKEVLLLHFFMVISAESKKRAPGLEGGKLKSLDKSNLKRMSQLDKSGSLKDTIFFSL